MLKVHHLGHSQSERIVWLCEALELPYELVKHTRDPVTRLSPPALKAMHPLARRRCSKSTESSSPNRPPSSNSSSPDMAEDVCGTGRSISISLPISTGFTSPTATFSP